MRGVAFITTTIYHQEYVARKLPRRRCRPLISASHDPVVMTLHQYAKNFDATCQDIAAVVTLYREQIAILRHHVEATITQLQRSRQLANEVHAYLSDLTPADTQRIKPYSCLLKLSSLDTLLTEFLLNIAMFGEVREENEAAV